jgi:signal transduction histidine kinase
MPYHALVPLSAAVANLVICLLVLKRGLREPLNRAFALMAICIVCWNLDIFCLYYFEDAALADWWTRVFRVGFVFAPATAFHFALVLSESTGAIWRGLLTGAYITAGALAIANIQGSFVKSLVPHPWGWYPEPGPLYGGFSASMVILLTLWAERVFKAYRTPSSPRQRAQAKFWLLAGVVQIAFAFTNLLAIYGFHTYPLGDMGSVFMAGTIAYAIVRHRLMDVDYVVRKLVSFALPVAIILVPGSIGVSALSQALGGEEPLIVACAAVGLALVAVVLIPTLQEALETRVQQALFPQAYDYRRRLGELGTTLVHVLNERELGQRLGESLSDILDVEPCDVWLRDDESLRLTRVYPPAAESEALAEGLDTALDGLTTPMLTSELDSTLLTELFRARRWEVGIPLRINQRLTGFVGLGRKRDFRIFSGEDLQLLASVAAGASVALENAHLSRQLRNSEQVLERANRLSSLGMLAAGIAHEIRNPLVAVKTFLDLLPSRTGDKEFMTNFRDLSLTELRRVTDLITDLLALGKSAATERRSVELGPIVEPIARLMDSTARKRGVQIVSHVQAGVPPIHADPDQLKQIILNLVLNAIDASPEGGRVMLGLRTPRVGHDRVILEVRDEGAGIAPDKLKSIFHPFFTTKDTGTGLGLALVHQMVVEHGGDIVVESELGRGSVFRVTLPTERMTLAKTGT